MKAREQEEVNGRSEARGKAHCPQVVHSQPQDLNNSIPRVFLGFFPSRRATHSYVRFQSRTLTSRLRRDFQKVSNFQ